MKKLFKEIKENLKKQKNNLPFITIAGIMVGVLIIFMGKYFTEDTSTVYGEDQLNNKTTEVSSTEEQYKHYKKLIEDNTILVLTDKSDKDKLLGMTKDIPYDK